MISIFQSLDKSSRPIKSLEVNDILKMIQNHPKKDIITKATSDPKYGGKGNENKIYRDKVWDRVKGKVVTQPRNMYQHVKSTKIWCVTWNCLIKSRRRKVNIDTPSGYIYCDVDTFLELIKTHKDINSIDEAKAYVWKILTSKSLKFIKAVWRSLSGEGFGFLVKVDELTVDNFKTTWLALRDWFGQHGIVLDAQTKDITRPNVISYDPNIFIRDDEDVRPYIAVEPSQKKSKGFKKVQVPTELMGDMLKYKVEELYDDGECWSNNRLQYGFYFRYFCFANYIGIDLWKSLDYLKSRIDDYPKLFGYRSISEVEAILNQVEVYYGDQEFEYHVYTKKQSPENEVEVSKIYQHYSGNIRIKLEYIWFNLKNKESEERVNIFTIIAKQNGIAKQFVIDFLSDKIYLEDSTLEKIDLTYGNWKIHYGLVKELTPEAIELRKKNFYDYCKVNFLKITKRERYEGNVNRKLSELLNLQKGRIKNITSENIFDFLRGFFYDAKAFAISSGDALSFLNEEYTLSDEDYNNLQKIRGLKYAKKKSEGNKTILEYAKFLAPEIYNYDSWKFGINTTQCLNPKEVKNRYNITDTYKLNKGEYISDLNIPLRDNVVVWGNTGQGKTTWMCEKMTGYRLVLVPIISLLEGIQQGFEASVYYGDGKNVKEGDELIVCTYSSFPNLLKVMEKWDDVKISDYNLCFDEFHNMTTSSNPDFRNYELNHIVDNMHLFKSRMMFTGTLFPILHPAFEDFDIIRVEWAKTPPKKFKRIRYNDLLLAVERKLSKDGKNIIYLQNKREEGKLGELLDYLETCGWSRDRIWCINANEKNSPEFNKLITNKRVDDDVDIVICTSVIVEGVDIKNPDFKTVHFMSHEGIVNKEQMVNRLRNVFTHVDDPDCMIYLYKKIDDTPFEERDQVDVVKIQENLIKMAKESLDFFSKAYVSGDSISNKLSIKLFNQQIFGKSALFRNKQGVYDVDYLSISNLAYREEKQYAYHDMQYIELLLNEYNWQYKGEETVFDTIEDRVKAKLRANKDFRKEELIEDVLQIIQDIREQGEYNTIEAIEDRNINILEKTDRPEYEIGLRSKVKYLCNNMSFIDACNLLETWVQQHNMSDRIWSKIVRQINVKIAQELDIFNRKSDVTCEFAKALLKFFNKKMQDERKTGKIKLFTIKQFKNAIVKASEKCKDNDTQDISDEYSLETIKKYFDVKEVLVKNKIKYQLKGINISNDISTFSKMFRKWAEKMYEEKILISSQELANVINSLRSDLPLLGMYKLNSRQAMRLIHDYFGFERVSSRNINGRRTNYYQITSLFPEEISNVKIMPLRKISLMEKHYEDMTYDEKKVFNHQMKINSLTYHLSMKKSELAVV